MLNVEGGTVVAHTRESFSHTMGTFCSTIITETNTVASVRDTLPAVEFLTSANQPHTPGRAPSGKPGERDTGKQRHPCRWQRSPKRKTLCTCGCTKSHRNTTRLSSQGSSRRTPAARPWRDRRQSKNRSSLQVHTAGSPIMDKPLAHETTQLFSSALSMHTSTPCSESIFGAEHGKGSQTGCVPDTTPSAWQENVCSVSLTRCVRTAQMTKCLRLQSTTQRRCPIPGFLGKRVSTCLLNQETDYHLIQLHLLLSSGARLSKHTP